MIRGSDGLEYADEAALLLREPLDNTFNGNVRYYRERTRGFGSVWTEAKVRQYIEGFLSVCPEGYPGPSGKAQEAHNTGLEAAGFRSRRQSLAQANQYIAERIDRAAFAVLSGKSPTFAISDDFGVVTIDTAA